MKWNFLIIFFLFNISQSFVRAEDPFTSSNSDIDKAKIKEIAKLLRETIKERKGKPEYLYEERSNGVSGCTHCPKYFNLTHSVNKVIEAMKNDPKYKDNVELPVSLNRLNFLYYIVQSRSADGSINCNRYMDITPDLRQTEFNGQMKLLAEDVFKFEGISQLQILDPSNEEIIYYYRGDGDQKNIIVQAILTKQGGTFRYFRFIPSKENLNPYNLPALSNYDLTSEELAKFAVKTEVIATEELKISETLNPPDKDKFAWEVEPKLGKKLMSLSTNTDIAKADLSHGIFETGLRVNAKSVFSFKGNEASANIQNEEGENYVELNVRTKITGETERKIAIPYSVRLGAQEDEDVFSVKGKVEDGNKNQILTLELTDRFTQYIRAELKRDKDSNINTYAVAKDFSLGKTESMTVLAGKNETNKKFAALQHRKSLKNNVTMVLDVRIDEGRSASFYYNLHARF